VTSRLPEKVRENNGKIKRKEGEGKKRAGGGEGCHVFETETHLRNIGCRGGALGEASKKWGGKAGGKRTNHLAD